MFVRKYGLYFQYKTTLVTMFNSKANVGKIIAIPFDLTSVWLKNLTSVS